MNATTKSHIMQKIISSRGLLDALDNADLNLFDAIEKAVPAGYMAEFADELELIQKELNKRIIIVKESLNYWELALLNAEK